MKTIKLMVVAAVLAAAGHVCAAVADGGPLRVVVQEMMAKTTEALKAAPIPAGEPVAILPIDDDADAWLEGQLKTALTAAGKTCVTGKSDPMWNEILKEIEWGTRKADILDPKTLTAFGKLKTARILLQGNVRFACETPRYAFAELELHAVSIETKQHLWGATLPVRQYKDATKVLGISEIPVQVRQVALDKFRTKLTDSLRKANKKGLSVGVLPLAGDQDSYVSGLVRDAVLAAELVPVNLSTLTPTEARLAVREQTSSAKAFFSGAVRDLSATLVETRPHSKIYRIDIEVQAFIEDGTTHQQVWSETLGVSENCTITAGVWDIICGWFPAVRTMPWLLVAVPLALLVLLVVVGMFLRAMTRVR